MSTKGFSAPWLKVSVPDDMSKPDLFIEPGLGTSGLGYRVGMSHKECLSIVTPESVRESKNKIVLREAIVIPEDTSDLGRSYSVEDSAYCVSGVFSGSRFIEYAVVSIPLVGMMNDDLGAKVVSVTGTRGVKYDKFASVFDEQKFVTLLREVQYKGFVSLLFGKHGDLQGKTFGIPYLGGYNVHQTLKRGYGSVVEGLINHVQAPHECDYIEAWSVASLVSSFPFPLSVDQSATRGERKKIRVGFNDDDARRHFYPLYNIGRDEFSAGGAIGVAVGWSFAGYSSRLHKASEFVLKTCRNIECPEIQYRTDIFEKLSQRWGEIKGLVQS